MVKMPTASPHASSPSPYPSPARGKGTFCLRQCLGGKRCLSPEQSKKKRISEIPGSSGRCKPFRSAADARKRPAKCAVAHEPTDDKADAVLLDGYTSPRIRGPCPVRPCRRQKNSPLPLRERDRVRGKLHELMLSATSPTRTPSRQGRGDTES